VYRLQVGVQSRDQALALCASLKKHSLACIPASG
jgi:SPOR domain